MSDAGAIAVIGIVAIFALLIMFLFTKRRSGYYREDLVNMYVAAKIRQLAKEDNLDLDKEYELYKRWVKKRNLEDKGLDSAIELELKEKISKDIPKETEITTD